MKQKKRRQEEQEKNENLAALTLLNNEAKNKDVIIHDVNGRSIEEGKEENPKLSPIVDNNAFTDSSSAATKSARSY